MPGRIVDRRIRRQILPGDSSTVWRRSGPVPGEVPSKVLVDSRKPQGVHRPLASMAALAVCACLSGAKGRQALNAQGLRYVPALTDPQARRLLDEVVLQMSLFTEEVAEVEHEGCRHTFRRGGAGVDAGGSGGKDGAGLPPGEADLKTLPGGWGGGTGAWERGAGIEPGEAEGVGAASPRG